MDPLQQRLGSAIAAVTAMAVLAIGMPVAAGWAEAPAQAAASGDFTLVDAADAEPRGDLRAVVVAAAGGGSLRFTAQVAEYLDPATDPAWTSGNASVEIYVDTSGDQKTDLVVDMFNFGFGPEAEVRATETYLQVCAATFSTNPADKSYSATIIQPGCLGDVKRPGIIAIFGVDHLRDVAPDFGDVARFDRPPPGQPAGGYAMVDARGGFERFGAVASGATGPRGRFDGFGGSGWLVATASSRPFVPALWGVTDRGQVVTRDGAMWHGDAAGIPLAQPIVGMAVLPNGSGYWLVARDGGVFAFGQARFLGSTGGKRLNQPVVGMAVTPEGQGYWLVAADGGIFGFGDARFLGSAGSLPLNQPVVGMASGIQGQGYWLVARDGGVFSYGVPFHGSTGGIPLQQPIVGIARSRSGGGYRLVARDAGLFSFGDAEFAGSGALPGRSDIVGVATA